MSALRIVVAGFLLNLKMVGTSSFFLLTAIVQPVIFATIAFYMYRSGDRSFAYRRPPPPCRANPQAPQPAAAYSPPRQ